MVPVEVGALRAVVQGEVAEDSLRVEALAVVAVEVSPRGEVVADLRRAVEGEVSLRGEDVRRINSHCAFGSCFCKIVHRTLFCSTGLIFSISARKEIMNGLRSEELKQYISTETSCPDVDV